jgi:class 3 adenylate cyclase
LAAQPSPKEQPIPLKDSERKHITVLSSDLSGYNAMTEQLDPEEAKEITRVDRLDDELKQVLRSASVIGRRILYRILRAIGEAVEELDTHLEQAEAIFGDIGAASDLSQAQKLLQVTPETMHLNSGQL